MAMPKGAGIKKWSTLATMGDAEVYAYFRNVRGQSPSHALNTLIMLRKKMTPEGGKREPRDFLRFYTPTPGYDACDAHVAPHGQWVHPDNVALKAEAMRQAAARELAEQTPETPETPETQAPAYAPPQAPAMAAAVPADGLAPLAAMLAPHMATAIEGAIAAHVGAAFDQFVKNQPHRLVVMREQVKRELDGQHHEAAPKVIQLATQGLNVMLVGPAGCGKTVLASSVAKAVERNLTVISCSAGMSEAQLLGRLLPLGAGGTFRYVESPFVKAYREGGVILLDEMDAADANLLLVINAALANGAVDIEARAANEIDTRVARHPDTIILAAANTWGAGADVQYIGRGALDVSTLDRFYRLGIDYDEALERQLGSAETVSFVQILRRKAREAKLRRVVSTRMITRLESALAAGVSFKDAKTDELASWGKDERAKVGEA